MSELKISVAKIVGAASDECWSQVHVFPSISGRRWVKLKKFNEGLLVVAVSVRPGKVGADEEIDLGGFGREVLQRVHEEYFGGVKKDREVELVEEIVDKVMAEFPQVKTELMVGVVRGEKLVVVGKRGGQATLWREGEWGRIYKANERGVVGKIKPGDVVVIGTRRLFEIVNLTEWRKILLGVEGNGVRSNSEEVVEGLAPIVHGSDNHEGVAGGIVTAREAVKGQKGVREQWSDIKGMLRFGFQEKVKKWGGKIAGKMWERKRKKGWRRIVGLIGQGKRKSVDVGGTKGRKPEVFLRSPKSRKVTISVGLVFGLLLIGSVILGWRKRIVGQEQQAVAEVYEPARMKYEEALSLAEVNSLRSRSMLIEAKELIEVGLEKLPKKNRYYKKLEKLAAEVEEAYQRVAGEIKIEEAGVFLDLGLVRGGTFGSMMALVEDQMVILDKDDRVVIGVDVATKKAEVVGGGELFEGVNLVGLAGRRGVAITNRGLIEFSLKEKTSAVLVEREEVWQEPRALATFGGNIYLLDGKSGDIWRYPGITEGVGARQRWLAPGIVPDFSRVTDMAIDGFVWVVTETGKLEKYTHGVPDVFGVVGLEKEFNKPTAVFTDQESKYLYILDKGNRRVVVLDKKGEYQRQYIWEGISTMSDMVVSEREGKILVLSGSTIYEIPLESE